MSANKPLNRAALNPPPATGLDLKKIYHVVLERFWLVILSVVVAALCSVVYVNRQPILYSANAVAQVEQEETRIVKVEKFQQEDLRWLDAIRTIEQTMKSRAVLERVVDSLNLTQDPAF